MCIRDRCTPYGVAVAEEFGYEMAKQGALVVSGMARGIDAAASGARCAPEG